MPPGQSFGKVWAADDYRLLPYNAMPLQPWGRPHGAIATRKGGGDGFPAGEANIRWSGVWGYRCFAEPSGATLAAALTADAAAVTVSDGAQFRVGQTVLLGAHRTAAAWARRGEQALVTAIAGNALTVTRGLNGTTPRPMPPAARWASCAGRRRWSGRR